MTAPHTLSSLEAMTNRELDAVVGQVVFGGCIHKDGERWMRDLDDMWKDRPLPGFCSTYDGFGQILERMRALGFAFEVSSFCGTAPGAVSFSKDNKYEWVHGDNLPHATAIAAVLSVQGAA